MFNNYSNSNNNIYNTEQKTKNNNKCYTTRFGLYEPKQKKRKEMVKVNLLILLLVIITLMVYGKIYTKQNKQRKEIKIRLNRLRG